MANPTAHELREHVAYEVHYLVLAAVRFTEVTGTEKAVYQDSSLLHALTLVEFTNPGQKTNYTWWIGDVGGQKPPREDASHADWREFINANASHLGRTRLEGRQWPVPKDEQRLIVLAKYLLQRVNKFSQDSNDPRAVVMERLSQLGLTYLDDPSGDNLAKIARAINAPLRALSPSTCIPGRFRRACGLLGRRPVGEAGRAARFVAGRRTRAVIHAEQRRRRPVRRITQERQAISAYRAAKTARATTDFAYIFLLGQHLAKMFQAVGQLLTRHHQHHVLRLVAPDGAAATC